MKVPERWWPGYKGNKCYGGWIASVNLNDEEGRYFMMETDEEPGANYPMNYKAVLAHADSTHINYADFNLPKQPPTAKKHKTRVTSRATSSSSARPSAAIKEEAEKLKKLISCGGVDVIADLSKRLDADDSATVNFLKTIYDVDEAKKCLLCEQNFVPGTKSKCSVQCISDADEMEFHKDTPSSCYGSWSGTCERCGEGICARGNKDWCDPSGFPVCYNGPHVSTNEEMKLVILSLQMRKEGSHFQDEFMDAIVRDKLAPDDRGFIE